MGDLLGCARCRLWCWDALSLSRLPWWRTGFSGRSRLVGGRAWRGPHAGCSAELFVTLMAKAVWHGGKTTWQDEPSSAADSVLGTPV